MRRPCISEEDVRMLSGSEVLGNVGRICALDGNGRWEHCCGR